MFETLSERLQAAFGRLRNKGVVRPEDIETALREVRIALLEADVNYRVVKDFSERVKTKALGADVIGSLSPAQQVVKVVHAELVELLGGASAGLKYSPRPPTVVMLVGLQGSGKTTTAVKLALLARREGHRPLVVALDLRRPAAVEQLRQLAARENVPFGGEESAEAVEAIARRAISDSAAHGCDVAILDTAGRLQVDEELMRELVQLKKTVPVTDTLLVADAMTGQEAVNVGQAFDAAVGIDGVVLTKLDGDARGGAALSLRVATGKPVRFAGVGEKPGDLEVFHPDRMASRILGMGDVLSLIEKAERDVNREEAERIEKSLREGRLTFDDMLAQMRQVRAMGSLDAIVGMLPGGAKLKGTLEGQDAEQEVRRVEAVILSMTPRERVNPDEIDGSRRRRIAKGAGVTAADVNRVLRSREQMQALMRQLTGSGRKGRAGVDIGRLLGGLR
jgi:signal recognition particle subunit SRP54